MLKHVWEHRRKKTTTFTELWLQGLRIAGEEKSKVHARCFAPGIALRVGLSPTPLSATTALVLKGGMWDCRGESAAQRGNRAPKNMSQTAQSFMSAKFNRSFELEITTNSCPVFASRPFPWVLYLVGFVLFGKATYQPRVSGCAARFVLSRLYT